jgi:wyosine [tRNA(Phe)-imidazoG37] synthetase (radical SAM superfamily)
MRLSRATRVSPVIRPGGKEGNYRMSSARVRNIFGPVASRRLGLSLGVDLIPNKACTYDCIYCQLGPTLEKTVTRREYIPTSELLAEFEQTLAAVDRFDYVTITGSGEPTLHAACGDIIRTIKTMTHAPVAILTNGSLLWDPEVREDVAAADVAIPSLDAGTPESFRLVNRPHAAIAFDAMVEGLVAFRAEFPGQIWLEVFLLDGINADPEELDRIADHVRRIAPDRVQINTATRPASEPSAVAVPLEDLRAMAARFGDKAEVIESFTGSREEHEILQREERIFEILRRRPCTLDELSLALGIHRTEVSKHLEPLVGRGQIATTRHAGKLFFTCHTL